MSALSVQTARIFAKDVLLVIAGDVVKSLRMFLLLPILTKSLGAESYGMWVQAKVTIVFLTPFVLLGLRDAVLRFLGGDQQQERIRAGFNTSVAAVAVFGAVALAWLWLFAQPVARVLFHTAVAAPLVMVLAGLVVCEALDQMTIAYFQTFRRLAQLSMLTLWEVAGELAVVGWMAWRGHGLLAILQGLLAWKGAVVLVKLFRIWYRIGVGGVRPAVLASYLGFGLPLLLSQVSYFVVNYADRYLINYLLGLQELGLYAVAYAIGGLLIVLVTPFDFVLYPMVSACWNAGDMAAARAYLRYALKYSVLLLVPLWVALVTCAGPMVRLVSGPEFLKAVDSVPWIAGGFLALGIGVVGERAMLLDRRAGLVSGIYAGLAVGNVALNLLLIPKLGIRGAAIATLVTFGGYLACMLRYLTRQHDLRLEWEVVGKALVAAGGMAMLIQYVQADSPGALLSALGGACALYLVLLGVLRVFSAQELLCLRGLVIRSD